MKVKELLVSDEQEVARCIDYTGIADAIAAVDIWSVRVEERDKKAVQNGDRSWECRQAIYQGLN